MSDTADPHHRRVAWPPCYNSRDLGGLMTTGGGRTAFGKIVRSSDVANLPAVYRSTFVEDWGISRIVDLRSDARIAVEPSPFASERAYVHRPLRDPGHDIPQEMALTDSYIYLLETWPMRLAAVCVEVAEAGEGMVVIHCQRGKDRTGVVCALLLSLAGVVRSEIVGDYCLSEVEVAGATQVQSGQLDVYSAAPADAIEGVLDFMDSVGGSAEYLRQSGGLSSAAVSKIRAKLAPVRN